MYEPDFPRRCDGPVGLVMKKHPLCTFLAGLVLAPALMLLAVSLITMVLVTPAAFFLGWL